MMVPFLAGMASGPTDPELVQRFKEGDQSAYTELVKRYQHRVYALCVRWMGNDRIAEEVAQDVFLALFRALPRFRGDAKLSTWVYRVVINHCKNRRLYRMRRKVDRHEPMEGTRNNDDEPIRQIASEDPGTDSSIHRSEAQEIIHEALDQMDEQQRQIIMFRDIEDLSYEEIGELLGLPRGTVKSRLHRARAQLTLILSRTLKKEDFL